MNHHNHTFRRMSFSLTIWYWCRECHLQRSAKRTSLFQEMWRLLPPWTQQKICPHWKKSFRCASNIVLMHYPCALGYLWMLTLLLLVMLLRRLERFFQTIFGTLSWVHRAVPAQSGPYSLTSNERYIHSSGRKWVKRDPSVAPCWSLNLLSWRESFACINFAGQRRSCTRTVTHGTGKCGEGVWNWERIYYEYILSCLRKRRCYDWARSLLHLVLFPPFNATGAK